MSQKYIYKAEKHPICHEEVETFQLDFIKAGWRICHSGDFALIFINRPSAYRASVTLN